MKKVSLLALIAALLPVSLAFAAGIGHLAWDRSNLGTLRSFDKDAVVKFINESGGLEGTVAAIRPEWIWEFEWVDLAGDGAYELAVIASEGPCCVDLWLYWQDAPGKFRSQSFDGAGKLSDTIRDLNGDGKMELILYKGASHDGSNVDFGWPAVYRLERGKYVEASRDFSNFYDQEVLPGINEQIKKYENWKKPNQSMIAALTMERNRILRVLGRNPAAGLKQAYQWMNSDKPYLLQDAETTFLEIGGHEAEARAAHQAWECAFCARHPRTAMCRNVVVQPVPAAEETPIASQSGRELTSPASPQQSAGPPPARGAAVHSEGPGVGAPVH